MDPGSLDEEGPRSSRGLGSGGGEWLRLRGEGRPECPWRSDWVGGWRVEVGSYEGNNELMKEGRKVWTCRCGKVSRQGQGSGSNEQEESFLPGKMKYK